MSTIDLTTVSEDELLAELRRRSDARTLAEAIPANRDYYAILSEDADDDGLPTKFHRFTVVHRRFWHLHHCGDYEESGEHCVIPDNADWCSEGTVEAKAADLTRFGFEMVMDRRWWADHTFVWKLQDGTLRLDIDASVPDADEEAAPDFMKVDFPGDGTPSPLTIGQLLAGYEKTFPGTVAVLTHHDPVGDGAPIMDVTLLARDLYEALPPDPRQRAQPDKPFFLWF